MRTASTADSGRQDAGPSGRVSPRLALAEALKSPNQELCDVPHYDLVLNLNPTAQILTGTVTVTATVTGPTLAVRELDPKDRQVTARLSAPPRI